MFVIRERLYAHPVHESSVEEQKKWKKMHRRCSQK